MFAFNADHSFIGQLINVYDVIMLQLVLQNTSLFGGSVDKTLDPLSSSILGQVNQRPTLTYLNQLEGRIISISDIIVIELVIVLENLLLDGRSINPAHVVFQLPSYQKSRLCHHFRPHSHVSLLDKGHGFLHCLTKFETTQHNCQSPSAEGRNPNFLCIFHVVFGVEETHVVQFLKELLCGLDPKGVVGRELLEFMSQSCDQSHDAVVVRVVLSVLEMVAMHHPALPLVRLDLPVVEIDLLQQLLLMELQLSHC